MKSYKQKKSKLANINQDMSIMRKALTAKQPKQGFNLQKNSNGKIKFHETKTKYEKHLICIAVVLFGTIPSSILHN